MANPEHVEIVKQGTEAIHKWRAENQDVTLDLSGADLSLAHLERANLYGADLRRARLGEAHLDGADLGRANLREANLGGASLRGANLCGANLYWAHLYGADLSEVHLDSTDLNRVNLGEVNLRGADLRDAHLCETNLYRANLREANLCRADLYRARLEGANLYRADLSMANLREAHLREANLYRAKLGEVQGAERVYHLETVRFISTEDTEGVDFGNDTSYFETCHRPWPEHWLDWERLRVVGRLPLFGISYTALILIPLVFYGLALYNRNIDLVHAWAKEAVTSPDHPLHRLAPHILEHLYHLTIPSLSFVLFVSTILLAAASTMYTAFCPSRVKEFSRDQWCD
jgi:uncharacterized protein YjbI with pentapeptide repeats